MSMHCDEMAKYCHMKAKLTYAQYIIVAFATNTQLAIQAEIQYWDALQITGYNVQQLPTEESHFNSRIQQQTNKHTNNRQHSSADLL